MSCPTCGASVCSIRCAEALAMMSKLGYAAGRSADAILAAVLAETPPAPDTTPPSPPGTERK